MLQRNAMRIARSLFVLLAVVAVQPRAIFAQHEQHADTTPHEDMMMPGALGISMERMGSGTTWIPDAVTVPSFHAMLGPWMMTVHGFVFGQYTHQGGPRGSDQFTAPNWAMGMFTRDFAGGKLQARAMLSLDDLTSQDGGYPMLLQTGETYEGQPIRDRQHPHDVLMEVGLLFERPVAENLALSLYVAPSGEPALGPVAFMHRPSAMDNPSAPLSHHWQDATHITFGVLTAGIFSRNVKLEGSLFNGREPDENRWGIDRISLDSWSTRLTFNPGRNWSLTAGYGFLKEPEASHPGESVRRVTAAAMYGKSFAGEREWSAAVVWGANRSSGHDELSHALLGEFEAILDGRNTILARAEYVQKSAEELLGHDAGIDPERHLNITALSAGYIRELSRQTGTTLGLGVRGTVNFVPDVLEPIYGSRTPLGLVVFLRLRPFHLHQPAANTPDGE